MRKLADFYLECGWDVDNVNFNARFLTRGVCREERGGEYWRGDAEPLEREARRVGFDLGDGGVL